MARARRGNSASSSLMIPRKTGCVPKSCGKAGVLSAGSLFLLGEHRTNALFFARWNHRVLRIHEAFDALETKPITQRACAIARMQTHGHTSALRIPLGWV